VFLIRNSAAAAALLIASAVSAQTPPPKTPPASPGTTPATGGKHTDPVFPTTTPGKSSVTFPTDLFRMNEVSKSIEMTDRQINQLNLMTEKLQTRYREQFERLASLPVQDQTDRRLLLSREYVNAWLSGATGVLNDRQLTRYQQLQTQFGGFVSLTDPVVQKALNLTDTQIAALQENVTWSNQQLAAIREQAAIDQARALQMFSAYNQASQERFNRLLTADQQRAWAQMTGEPFPFPAPFPVMPPPK
jgi:hypothetical protein